MLGRNGVSELHPPNHICLASVPAHPPWTGTSLLAGRVAPWEGDRREKSERKPKNGFKWVAGHGRSLWREGMELGQVRTGSALNQC